jgi:hypothetical protein
MLLRMTHLPDDSPDDWEYQESPKVQKSLRKILESRVGRGLHSSTFQLDLSRF